jgi:hypothetical protein
MKHLLTQSIDQASPIGQNPVMQALERGEKPPLPAIIDATMLTSFRDCEVQFFRSHVLKCSPREPRVPLIAGSAFAAGLEAYRRAYYHDGYSKESSFDIAILSTIDDWGDNDPFPQGRHSSRSLDRVLTGIRNYFEVYPPESDLFQPHLRADNNAPTFEFNFVVPLDPARGFPVHPSSGEPFMWAGRSDGLGSFRRLPVFSDEKSTESLGATWSDKWLLRNQFLSYAWCYREMGLPYRSALVRGIGLLKTKITHAEALIQYPDHVINLWERNAIFSLDQMVQMWEADQWPARIGNSCTSFGNCQFMDVCLSHPQNTNNILSTGYMYRNWDPASQHNRRTAIEEAFLYPGAKPCATTGNTTETATPSTPPSEPSSLAEPSPSIGG